MEKKCNRTANRKVGWYGVSKEEIWFCPSSVMEFNFLLLITFLIVSKLLFKTKAFIDLRIGSRKIGSSNSLFTTV